MNGRKRFGSHSDAQADVIHKLGEFQIVKFANCSEPERLADGVLELFHGITISNRIGYRREYLNGILVAPVRKPHDKLRNSLKTLARKKPDFNHS